MTSRTKTSRGWYCIAAALIALMLLTSGSASAQDADQLRTLTAFGQSDVRVPPDYAQVRVGVETEATTATEAREQNAERAGRIIERLQALGIPESAIQTSIFQVNPVRRFDDPNMRGEPPIVGYRVLNVVSVRTNQFDLIPRIIDESIQAGANRVEGVNFLLEDEAEAKQRALSQAVSDARANAQAMAEALQVRLVRIQNVQQGGAGVTPPMPLYRGLAAEAAQAPTPILPGEITVNASATLTYVIE